MESIWLVAALWIGLALIASLISMRAAISVALVEIVMGVIGGKLLGMHSVAWTDFLAGFGSILLTFMAGAEIEPGVLRKYLKESLSIGFISFLIPFLGAMAYAYYVAHWTRPAAQIAGIALSTTSVAVVYAVMVETGLNKTDLGKLILAACFVTDLGTVLALGVLFANYNIWLAIFAAVTTAVLIITPRFSRWFFQAFGGHVSEAEIKLMFFLLFGLGGLAAKANSEAVLPAYLLGLVVAALFAENKTMVRHLRTTVFAFLTPFYFLKAGMLVSLPAVWAGAALIVILLLVKMVTKFVGVWPLTRAFRFTPRTSMYTTLLMSTGLTFGSISALFGYTRQILDRSQYTILVTVVIASAIVPTMIAQAFFRPKVEATAGATASTELVSLADE
ncbi:MAG: cation:proton antiporter [Acidobacteria bacterium]|nr:cation:proton antiporter [Acidobacteriota bacterium]